ERVLRRALGIYADYAPVIANLGVLEYERGRVDDAVRALRQASMLAPHMASIHYNLAVALYRQGHWGEAIRQFDQTLNLDPRNPDAARNKRWIQEIQGGATGGVDLPRPQAKLVLGEFAS